MDFLSRLDDKVSGLSTSEVAALIALATFALQLLLSFIWPVILVGFISERESAVTWSVAGRLIHNSYWPTVLRTDATASSGTRRTVSAVSYGVILSAALISIAGIVTPLGLYEDVVPSDDTTSVEFHYAPDTSPLGLGTARRHDSLGFSRICSGDKGELGVCPHSYQNLTTTTINETTTMVNVTGGYDTRIPKNTYEFFQSGISRLGRSVSSIFDIEYRTYRSTKDTRHNFTQDGDPYLVGDYRRLTSVLLNDDLDVVEGLVIDTKNGGIGFRNHTVPAEALQYGASWDEDLLFIEPVTECIDTNITLRYNIPENAFSDDSAENVVLIDRGGFIDLTHEFPPLSSTPGQEDPELAYRAYSGAWVNNALTMLYLNITNPNNETTGEKSFSYVNSEKGREFRLPVYNTTNSTTIDVKSMSISPYLEHLNLPSRSINGSFYDSIGLSFEPPNPFRIATDNFTDMSWVCLGALGGDYANITNVAGMCGLVTGIPRRTDGSESVLVESGTEWDVPLYYCASASRAILKTVSFYVNSTGLTGLEIRSVAEKDYRDESEYPIWAVENSERRLSAAAPLWGLAEDEDAPFGEVAFKRHPHLWLNAVRAEVIKVPSGDGSENLPGTYFHSMALGVAYAIRDNKQYNGVESLPIYNRWKELTKTTEGTAKLINLVWTDVAANAVVGTRGQMPRGEPPGLGPAYDVAKSENRKRADDGDDRARVPVHIFNRRVKYKLPYAVPAFVVLAFALAALGLGLVAVVLRGATPNRVRSFLTQLSAGRIMTATLLPGVGVKGEPTETWLSRQGRVTVDISGTAPRVDGGWMTDDAESTQGMKDAAPGQGVDPASKMLEGNRGAA